MAGNSDAAALGDGNAEAAAARAVPSVAAVPEPGAGRRPGRDREAAPPVGATAPAAAHFGAGAGAPPPEEPEAAPEPITDYGILLDTLSDAVVVADTSNRIAYVNSGIRCLLGWEPDELVGRPLITLMPPQYRGRHVAAFSRYIETGRPRLFNRPLRLTAQHRDGHEVVVELILNHCRLASGRQVIVGCLRDVADVAERERQSAIARDLVRALAKARTLQDATRRILKAICERLGWDVAVLWVVDERAGLLRCADMWQSPGAQAATFEAETRSATFARGFGLPGRVWEEGEPVWIEDAATTTGFSRAAAAGRDRLHAGFAFPVTAEGEVLGVIEFFTREIRSPDLELLSALGAIGVEIGQFLATKRADQEMEFQRTLLEAQNEASPDGIIVVGEGGDVIFRNRRFVEMWAVPDGLLAPGTYESLHGHMSKLVASGGLPSRPAERRAPLGDQTPEVIELADGRVFERHGAQIASAGGTRYGNVWYFRDVTKQRRAERELQASHDRAAFLVDASKLLAQSLDVSSTLLKVAGRCVPRIAQWCAFDIVRPEGGYTRMTAARCSDDPGEVRTETTTGSDSDPPGRAARVMAVGEPELHEAVGDDRVRELTGDDDCLATVPGPASRSALVVPMPARGRIVGAVTLVASDRTYGSADLELAVELAQRAALAIDNARLYEETARLYERERRIAETLQRSLLPRTLPDVHGAVVAARYLPGAAGLRVGGDWYDAFTLDDGRVAVALGDVVGRGITAASVMGQLRMALRVFAILEQSPAAVLDRLDELMNRLELGDLATAVYIVFDPVTGRLAYASAGHPAPVLLAPDGSARFLQGGESVALGVTATTRRTDAHTELEPGSALLLYTDGLVERPESPLDDGLERLLEAATDAPGDPDGLCARILDTMLSGHESGDDVALVALHYPHVHEDALEIRVAARPESVRRVRRRIEAWLRAAGASEQETFDITLACGEACANAVEHAYDGRLGVLAVQARVRDSVVTVAVGDEGRWRRRRDPDRGRGMLLMGQLMDDVRIERRDGGTRVVMTRRLRGG